ELDRFGRCSPPALFLYFSCTFSPYTFSWCEASFFPEVEAVHRNRPSIAAHANAAMRAFVSPSFGNIQLARRSRHSTKENVAMAKKEAKKLDELFHDTLKDIYFAEKRILTTLHKMEKAAQAPQLKRAFSKHKTETEGHVTRLEKVFASIDKKPQAKTCDAIIGI